MFCSNFLPVPVHNYVYMQSAIYPLVKSLENIERKTAGLLPPACRLSGSVNFRISSQRHKNIFCRLTYLNDWMNVLQAAVQCGLQVRVCPHGGTAGQFCTGVYPLSWEYWQVWTGSLYGSVLDNTLSAESTGRYVLVACIVLYWSVPSQLRILAGMYW